MRTGDRISANIATIFPEKAANIANGEQRVVPLANALGSGRRKPMRMQEPKQQQARHRRNNGLSQMERAQRHRRRRAARPPPKRAEHAASSARRDAGASVATEHGLAATASARTRRSTSANDELIPDGRDVRAVQWGNVFLPATSGADSNRSTQRGLQKAEADHKRRIAKGADRGTELAIGDRPWVTQIAAWGRKRVANDTQLVGQLFTPSAPS